MHGIYIALNISRKLLKIQNKVSSKHWQKCVIRYIYCKFNQFNGTFSRAEFSNVNMKNYHPLDTEKAETKA